MVRRRPGQPAFVTREQIIDAAETLAKTDGLPNVSVRRVSAALSVTPAALYWHLDSKQELVSELVDRAQGRIELPDPAAGTWLERLIRYYDSTRQVFLEYPGISEALMTVQPTEATLLSCLRVYELLVEGGFDEDAAVSAFNAMSTFISGHLMMIDTARFNRRHRGGRAFTPNQAQLRQLLADRPEFVAFVRALAEFDNAYSRTQFLQGIELLVRGAAATAGVPVPESVVVSK